MNKKHLHFFLSAFFFQIFLTHLNLAQGTLEIKKLLPLDGIPRFSSGVLQNSGYKITLDSMVFDNINKLYFEYDEEYNVTSIIQTMIDGKGKFETKNGITTVFYWDFNTSNWVYMSETKTDKQFNNDEDIILETVFHRSKPDEQWKAKSQKSYEYIYDNDGNLISQIIYDYNLSYSLINPSHKKEYTYNIYGNEISVVESNWNTTSEYWELYHQTERTYDDPQILITEVFSSFNNTLQSWSYLRKYEYINDDHGNALVCQRLNWNTFENKWEEAPYSKSEFTYDLTVSSENIIRPVEYIVSSKNKMVSTTTYQEGETHTVRHYYSDDFISSLPNHNHSFSEISIFPNPATDLIQLKNFPTTTEAVLTDITGRTFNFNLVDGKIDISSLNPGMYTLFINQNTYKILKK